MTQKKSVLLNDGADTPQSQGSSELIRNNRENSVTITNEIVRMIPSTTGDYRLSEINRIPRPTDFRTNRTRAVSVVSNALVARNDTLEEAEHSPQAEGISYSQPNEDTHWIGSENSYNIDDADDLEEARSQDLPASEIGNDMETVNTPDEEQQEIREFAEESVSEVAIPHLEIKNTKRKLPRIKGFLERGGARSTANLVAHVNHNHPRPVIYRMKPLSAGKNRQLMAKRTRVTRQIVNHKIPQYHLEQENTTFSSVKEREVSETIESYLDRSKLFMQKSSEFYDEIVATAVEYDSSVKVLHFGRTVKKHSCKQKRHKFQTSWWQRHRIPFQKPPSGQMAKPLRPVFTTLDDSVIYADHSLCTEETSELQKVLVQLRYRLNRRRKTDDVILDSSYFAREFFLTKKSISLRITRSSDVPECYVPPTLRCGYFPHSAQTIPDKKNYLVNRYKEAQLEYLNLTYCDLKPPSNFKTCTVTADELYYFHKMGRHIHGFFIVWEDLDNFHCVGGNDNDLQVPKRYLVDMFNFLRFPLFVNYKNWETRLKVAFDRTTVYNLHLAEIIRSNRPVFDTLSRNKSCFQPLTLREIKHLMDSSKIDAKYYLNSVGKPEFYEWGRTATNVDYLSAFFIICGGSKVAMTNFKLEKPRVYTEDCLGTGVRTSDGAVYSIEMNVTPKEFHVESSIFSEKVETEHQIVRTSLPPAAARVTRVIAEAPKEEPEVLMPRVKRNPRDPNSLHTRKELMALRNKKLGIPNGDTAERAKKGRNSKKEKKKPGRKPETEQDKGLKKHDFDIHYIPSDNDSDFEGYLSDSEEFIEKRPTLKRTTSTESFFLDISYGEHVFDKVSWMHQQKFFNPHQKFAKKRKRKMNRTVQKHLLRFNMLVQEDEAFKEMVECYHGNLPRTASEIAKTKNAMRNPHKFAKFNIPKVFKKGESQLVDSVYSVLKECITHTVALEHASARAGNGISRALQKARTKRQCMLDRLDTKNTPFLPKPEYIAIEALTSTRMTGRDILEKTKMNLLRSVDRMYQKYMDIPQSEKQYLYNLAMTERGYMIEDDLWNYSFNRRKQLDKSLKTNPVQMRGLIALQRREEQRRRARQEYSQKVIQKNRKRADLELSATTPVKRSNVERLQSATPASKSADSPEALKEAQKRQKEEEEKRKQDIYQREKEKRADRLKEIENKLAMKGKDHPETEKSKTLQNVHKTGQSKKWNVDQDVESSKLEEEKRAARKRTLDESFSKNKRKLETEMIIRRREEEENAEKERLLKIKQSEEEEKRKLLQKLREKEELIQKRRSDEEEKIRKQRLEEEAKILKYKAEEEKRIRKQQLDKERIQKERLEELRIENEKLEEERVQKQEEKIRKQKQEDEERARVEEERIQKLKLEKEKRIQKELEKELRRVQEQKLQGDSIRKQQLEEAHAQEAHTDQWEEQLAGELEITLFKISTDPHNGVYKSARQDFRSVNPRRMFFEKAGELANLLIRHFKVPSDKIVKYFTSLVDKTQNNVNIREKYEVLFKNISKCFKYEATLNENGSSSRREWKFYYDLEVIFDGVPEKLKEAIFEKLGNTDCNTSFSMTTPKSTKARLLRSPTDAMEDLNMDELEMHFGNSVDHDDQTAVNYTLEFNTQSDYEKEKKEAATPKRRMKPTKNLIDDDDDSIFKKTLACRKRILSSEDSDSEELRETTSTTVFSPRNTPATVFWQTIVEMESEKTNEKQKEQLSTQLSHQLLLNSKILEESSVWIFGLLGALRILYSGKRELVNFSQISLSDDELATTDRSNELFTTVLNNLSLIACNIQEGAKCEESLLQLFSFNGFSIVLSEVISSLKCIASIVKTRGNNDANVALNELFNSFATEIGKKMIEEYKIPEKKVLRLNEEMQTTCSLIYQERYYEDHSVIPTYSSLRRKTRLNTIIKWFEAVCHHHAEKILEAIQETLQSLRVTPSSRSEVVFSPTSVSAATFVEMDSDQNPERLENSNINDDTDNDIVVINPPSENPTLEELLQNRSVIISYGNINHEKTFATAQATVTILNSQGKKKLYEYWRAVRAQAIEEMNTFPTRLPKYDVNFVENVWKIIEKNIAGFKKFEKGLLKRYTYTTTRHLGLNPYLFHAMMFSDHMKEMPQDELRMLDDDGWHFYKQLSCKGRFQYYQNETEDILKQFEHSVLSLKTFNKMQWSVKCRSSDRKKEAIHYFTDLEKYVNLEVYKNSLSFGVLTFKFKVYKHLWFMGNLIPRSYTPESHEDIDFKFCAGCTSGEVIIIHNCICEYTHENYKEKFIYAASSEPVGLNKVTRLMGRFVCEHGPSSYLHLVYQPDLEKGYFPSRLPSYVEFEADLPIVKRKTMFDDLVQTFENAPTLLAYVESRPNSPFSTNSSYDTVDEDSDRSAHLENSESEEANQSWEELQNSDVEEDSETSKVTGCASMDPRIVEADKSYLAAEASRIAQLIKRIEDPKVQMFREKRFNVRSRSTDGLRKRKQNLVVKRSSSVCKFAEIEKYAKNKMENTKKEISTKLRNLNPQTSKQQETELEKDVQDIATLLGGIRNVNDEAKYAVLTKMLNCGETRSISAEESQEKYHEISQLFDTTCFQRIKGAPSRSLFSRFNGNRELISETSISIVMDEYDRFEEYKVKTLAEAKTLTALDKLLTKETKPYNALILAYKRIFNFNMALFEHLLNTVSKHVFNPYAIYHAESCQNISFIRFLLNLFKKNIPTLVSLLFNRAPLQRQLEELSELQSKYSPTDLKNTAYSLARYAIERIRVPQNCEKKLNNFVWLNSTGHRETVDFFQLYASQTLPSDDICSFDDFIQEASRYHFCEEATIAQCKTFYNDYCSAKQTLLTSFFDQNAEFYKKLEALMPNKKIDPMMKAYYQHQAFTRLYNIVHRRTQYLTLEDVRRTPDVCNAMIFHTIIAHPQILNDIHLVAVAVDSYYTHLCKFEARPLLVSPSYIGSSFVCFKKAIFVSAVLENEILVSSDVKEHNRSCMRFGECSSDLNYKTCRIILIANQTNSKLHMIFKSNNQVRKDDRLEIGKVNESLLRPQVNWKALAQEFIGINYNKMQSYFNKQGLVEHPSPDAYSRLENYIRQPVHREFDREHLNVSMQETYAVSTHAEGEDLDPGLEVRSQSSSHRALKRKTNDTKGKQPTKKRR